MSPTTLMRELIACGYDEDAVLRWMADKAIVRGRRPRLSEAARKRVTQMLRLGCSQSAIARTFGVHRNVVTYIAKQERARA